MLNRDFSDMLSSLNGAGVEYIIVGAYALAAHGFPRATGDIDIFVNRTPANAQRIMAGLNEFGASLSDISLEDWLAPDMIVQIGIAPCRIEIITAIDGVEFAEAWHKKIPTTLGDLQVNVLSKQDLLKNKLATGRDKDQGDIAWLKKNS